MVLPRSTTRRSRLSLLLIAACIVAAACAQTAPVVPTAVPGDADHAGEHAAVGTAAKAPVDDHDHAKEAAASPGGAAAAAAATNASDTHADDHASETTAAAPAAADEHAGETAAEHAAHAAEGGSHAGHSHGVSLESYCAALAAGEDPCAAEELIDYNLGLHIGSIFILLGVSLAGALLPVVLHLSSTSTLVATCVKLGTYFGFGTILATAFIHMMLPAAENLSSPCLPAGWNEAYEAWAYMFVTVSIVFMQLIDYLIEGAYQRYLQRRGGQPHGKDCHEQADCLDEHTHHAAVVGAIASMHKSRAHLEHPPHEHEREHTHGHGHAHDHAAHAHAHDASAHDPEAALDKSSEAGSVGEAPCAVHGEGCSTLMPHSEPTKSDPSQTVGIYLMEAGIIFHSVLIGITLGVTAGSAFDTLLVALAFHQFFEGFAIGSAVVDNGLSVGKSVAMGLAYSVTTPLGIAVGIAVRESFNQNAQTTLMVEGIFDSISTGILIYVVLVELINPLMTQSVWLRSRTWPVQVLAFLSFYAGVTVMAVIGKWV